MSIQVGDKAPDFSLVGLGEGGPEIVKLSEQIGEKNILLLFVPMAYTGEAYGIAYDQFLPEKNLIMGGVPKRSAFLVDRNGVVQYAQVNDSPGDLPDFSAIKAKLAELS